MKTNTKGVVMVTFEPLETCWMEAQKHFMKMGGFPKGLPLEKKRFYRLQNNGFHLVDDILFKIFRWSPTPLCEPMPSWQDLIGIIL